MYMYTYVYVYIYIYRDMYTSTGPFTVDREFVDIILFGGGIAPQRVTSHWKT